MIDPIWYRWVFNSFCVFALAFWLCAARPILDLWFDCGLLQISTELMNEHYSSRQIRYISLRITILNKWGGSIRLYNLR